MILTEQEFEQLRALQERLSDMARQFDEVCYGFFPGGDPNDFCPDPEASSEEEIANHKRACELYNNKKIDCVDGRHHFPVTDSNGQAIGHITHAIFGIGTYTIKDESVEQFANQLGEWIDSVRDYETLIRR